MLRSHLLAVVGQWRALDGSMHLIARRLVDMTPWLGELAVGNSYMSLISRLPCTNGAIAMRRKYLSNKEKAERFLEVA